MNISNTLQGISKVKENTIWFESKGNNQTNVVIEFSRVPATDVLPYDADTTAITHHDLYSRLISFCEGHIRSNTSLVYTKEKKNRERKRKIKKKTWEGIPSGAPSLSLFLFSSDALQAGLIGTSVIPAPPRGPN